MKYQKKEIKEKVGRKPLWDVMDMESKLDSIQGWAKQGSTVEDICKMLNISKETYYKWQREKKQFANAIKKGKEVSNGELLNSAFKAATGFMYKEKEAFKVKDYKEINGELKPIERVEVIEVEKYSPPDHTMNIFMIKNRLPDQYKDRQEVNTTNLNLNKDVSSLTDEELEIELTKYGIKK